MERTLLNKNELAERWGCSPGYIQKLEENGVIKRVGLSKVLYPISNIREIEQSEEPSPTLETVKKLRLENRKLSNENKFLKESLAQLSKIVYES